MDEREATRQRVTYFIDGFNLYHGLKEHTKARDYRWLNLWSFAQDQLLPGHILDRVLYFTSIPPWNRGKAARHERYIAALESVGVEVVRGRFQEDQVLCLGKCGELFVKYNEKLTDVHIATSIIRDGVAGKFDWAYLVSGDADQAPTLRTLKEMAPLTRVRVLFPPRRHSTELTQVADDFVGPLGHRVFKHHLFPETITVGNRVIEKPPTW